MALNHKLLKQKELIEMELAADTDSDAYEEDSSAEEIMEKQNCRKSKKRPVLVRSQTGDFTTCRKHQGCPQIY
jgi:hypothetical protein